MIRARIYLLLLSLIVLGACGNDSSAPPSETPPETTRILPADPAGLLLPGADGDPALPSVTLLPSPASADDLDGEVILTRLTAVAADGATVGQVNGTLVAFGVTINSMAAGSPLLSLHIPARATPAEAQALADSLVSAGGFTAVWPARVPTPVVPGPQPAPGALAKLHPPHADAMAYLDHLGPARVPGIWSTSRAATSSATLLVAGLFPDNWDYADLFNLDLVPGFDVLVPEELDSMYRTAADVVHMTGVAAANWDYGYTEENTDVDPLNERLAVQVVSTFVFTWSELMTSLGAQQIGPRTALLTYDRYDDPDFVHFPLQQRLYDALHWRCVVQLTLGGADFVHVGPSGSLSRGFGVSFDSPYGIADAEHLDGVAYGVLNEAAADAFAAHFASLRTAVPALADPPGNFLLVGSSDREGRLSSFADSESDVRMVGEEVSGHCGLISLCGVETTSRRVSSNAVAAAQVVGLATYLWHLAPELTSAEILLRLQHAYTASWKPGLVDGWIAAFSADRSLSLQGAPARLALLDVDSTGTFTEDDLSSFVEAFEQLAGNDTYFTRWDLNGDGRTGGSGVAPVDLDVNVLPGFTTITQDHDGIPVSYDERSLTDQEVLCYYAWSPLYTGDEGERRRLLPDCAAVGEVELTGSLRRVMAISRPGNRYIVDEHEYAHTDQVSVTATADSASSTIQYAGSARAQVQHESTLLQANGKLTGLVMASSCDAAISAAWPPLDKRADNWDVYGQTDERVSMTFTVSDQPVPYEANLQFDFPEADGFAEVWIVVELDGEEEDGFSYSETLLLDGDLNWSGLLQPDEYTLTLRFAFQVGAREDEAPTSRSAAAAGDGTWSFDLDFTP